MRSAHLVSRRSNALSIGRRTAAAVAVGVASGLALISAPGAARAATAGLPAPNLVWSTLSPPASPAPLAYSAAAYDSDNRTLVMFGGVTSTGALSNTTWVWNGSTWHGYAGSQIVSPQARELAAMAFDPVLHQLVLFGGRGYGGEVLGDTWAWNGASWYQVSKRLTGVSPSAREGAAMAYDGRGNLVMFGGDAPSTGSGSGRTAGSTETGAGSPGAGSTAGSSVDANGPAPPTVSLGDTWLWTSGGWAQSPSTGPAARTSASMAFDSSSGLAVMFGGSSSAIASGAPGYLGDTWTWNGDSWSALQAPSPSASAAGANGAAATTVPTPRFAAAAAADPTAGGVVLFGGAGPEGVLSDTWVWNGRAWSQTPASGNPDARAGAGCAYDSAAGQLLMFGGAVAPTGRSGGAGGPGGTYGAAIGAAGRVLGSTSVLTAGGPVGLGGSSSSLPAGGGPAAPSLAPGRSPESAAPGPSGGTGTQTAPVGPGRRSTASALAVLRRGEVVTLRGTGFSPRTKVTVTFHSTPAVVGATTSGAAGEFVITVAVPQSASAGTHRFFASGEGPKGPVQLLVATVRVIGTGGAPAGATAAERAALVGLALALPLATWLAMGAFGRWRRGAHRISSQRQDS